MKKRSLGMREVPAARKVCPSEGIYYITRGPDGWLLTVRCFTANEDFSHGDFWEEELARRVAVQWAKRLRCAAVDLVSRLRLLTYAFPRGRVTKVDGKFLIRHGKNLLPFMRVSRKEIERAFGISGRCQWELDEHEQCLKEDKEAIRDWLGIEEDWPAV